MYELKTEERETIVSLCDGDKNALIYTCSPKLIKELDEMCRLSTIYVVVGQDKYSKTYKCPKRYIRFVKPRQVSSQNRAKMAIRAEENLNKSK
jgi:hypothetical protein